jgi:hypothetical protein
MMQFDSVTTRKLLCIPLVLGVVVDMQILPSF